MIQLIKRMIFAWRYKRAVARACKYAKLYGRKYYVLYMGGKLKVVPKRNICELIHRHRFRKGTTIRVPQRHRPLAGETARGAGADCRLFGNRRRAHLYLSSAA